MTASVVDTNVLQVANLANEQANAEHGTACILAAVEALRQVSDDRSLLLDSGGEIMSEYRKQRFSYAGQPGVGDQFFRWVHQNAASLTAVRLTAHPDRDFAEFPGDPALERFDRDDRVFVAVAAAGPKPNRIVNAVDSDYRIHQQALQQAGITVEEICPNLLTGP